MNGVDPAPQDVSSQKQLLSGHRVKALLYNQQVTDTLTQTFLSTARSTRRPGGRRLRDDADSATATSRGCSRSCTRCDAPSPATSRPESCDRPCAQRSCACRASASGSRAATVLESVGFDDAPASSPGLIGSNGAGKTTLLPGDPRAAGADAGAGRGARSPATAAPRPERRGSATCRRSSCSTRTCRCAARDLVGTRGRRAPPRRCRCPRARAASASQEMLEAVDAPASPMRASASCPGGEQQRILIAHALVSRPAAAAARRAAREPRPAQRPGGRRAARRGSPEISGWRC